MFDILDGLKVERKKIDLKNLPSRGLFYKDDFKLTITKASDIDIERYEKDFNIEDINLVINRIKRIVKSNSYYSKDYDLTDLKSIDIIFLFLEIVNFTKESSIKIKYKNTSTGRYKKTEFSSKTFNYFGYDSLLEYYDNKTKQFIIDGFKFSLPSIGVENSLTNHLITTLNDDIYEDYNYNFIYFTNNAKNLKYKEVSNLLEIFNNDLSDKDRLIVDEIIEIFKPIQKYSLLIDGKVVDINSKLDLEKIWK